MFECSQIFVLNLFSRLRTFAEHGRTLKNIQCSVAPDQNIHQTQTEHIQDVNLPRIRTLDKLLSGKAELILIIPKKAKGSPS